MLLAPMMKVAGVGDGTFVILLFLAIAIFVTIIGCNTTKPHLFAIGSFAVPIILTIIFVLVPKGENKEAGEEEYDPYWVRRVCITVVLSLFAAGALVISLLEFFMMRVEASKNTKERTS